MRTIGLIGGMSWESSAEYYRLINQQVRDRLGPLRSAQLLMHSVDFGPVEQAQHAGRWDDAAQILVDAARRLQAGGAECAGKGRLERLQAFGGGRGEVREHLAQVHGTGNVTGGKGVRIARVDDDHGFGRLQGSKLCGGDQGGFNAHGDLAEVAEGGIA